MIDHRLVQRTLFRMQIDAAFAARVFAREAEALDSTGLESHDLEWLWAADPVAISADPGGRRLAQLLGNVVAEYVASVALFVERAGATDIARAFATSPEFHEAIRFDRALPVEFGRYAARRASAQGDATLDSVLAFERAMVEARRGPREVGAVRAGEVVLSGSARWLELSAGTFELAGRLAAEPEAGVALGDGRELLLLTTVVPPHSGALHGVNVEVLSSSVGEVLRAVREPLDAAGRRALAEARGVDPGELDEFLRSLLGEGLLEGGL